MRLRVHVRLQVRGSVCACMYACMCVRMRVCESASCACTDITTVEELDQAIMDGRAEVVVATSSSPDGLLKGKITMS
jgi:hypothetical protein